MSDIRNTDFQTILEQYKNMIHYHIHRLGIRDTHDEFLQEGVMALFFAYKAFDESKGTFDSYASHMIRHRLIDNLRKIIREKEKTDLIINESHSKEAILHELDLFEKEEFWKRVKQSLTEKQWKWVYWYIIHGYAVKEIAAIEQTTEDAVKNWGKEVKRKLRDSKFIQECRK